MVKFVILSVFAVVSAIVQVSYAGSVSYPHRETTLDDLKTIDRYVSSALPVLQDGFFIGTPRGPILVKSQPHPTATNKRPTVRTKYYNTLPRLIPAGFEGVAISHFNLGAAAPIQHVQQVPVVTKQLNTVPGAHSQQYISTNPSQPTAHYVTQHGVAQPQHIYTTSNQQPQQYVAEARQPQQYIIPPHQQQIIQTEQSQQQIVQVPQPQQYFIPPRSQYTSEQQVVDSQPAPQETTQHILERSQSISPVAQPSFQVDNLLKPDQDQSVAYQSQHFGAERFQSQKLVPNSAVLETNDYEDTLPETLRNRFYKNANLATILAQESLPIQGEQIIHEWDTNKIAKGKIHALLRGAGFI